MLREPSETLSLASFTSLSFDYRDHHERDCTSIGLAIALLVERGSVSPVPLVLSCELHHHLAFPDALLQDLSPAISDRLLKQHSIVWDR